MSNNLTERNKAAIHNKISDAISHTPIETRELAERFSSEVWEKFGNSTSESLINLWAKVFESFNEVWLRNQSSHIFDKKNIIIPAPTGSGKSLCMRFYAAAIANNKERGMMIITKLISEADEAVNQINQWSESTDTVAVAYHSESSYQHNEVMLKDFPILIITHENFIRNHHPKSANHSRYKKLAQFKDGERTCIVVDESIELIKHIGVSKDLIDSLSNKMREPYADKPRAGLEDEYRLLSFLSNNYNNLFLEGDTANRMFTLVGDNKEKLLDRLTEELQLPRNEVIGLFKLKKTLRLTGNNIKNIDHIQFLLDDGLYLYKSGKKIEYRTSSLEMPSKSMVVLDATANVNKAYDYYEDTDVIALPKVKTYENVTIMTHKTKSGLGKNALVGQTLKEDQTNINSINLFFMDKGKESVIFTFKDFKEELYEDGIDIDHFGNLTGVNKYKDKEHIIVYGMHYKPRYVDFDEQYQSLGPRVYLDDDKKSLIELRNSKIAADIIQMINRGRCRGIADTNKAPDMIVDLPLPKDKNLREVIINAIRKEMPGVNITEAKSLLTVDYPSIKTKKAVGKDKLFIGNIDVEEQRIKVSDIYRTINATKKDKERIAKHLGKSEYRDSYLRREISSLGFSAVKDGQWYLVKDHQ